MRRIRGRIVVKIRLLQGLDVETLNLEIRKREGMGQSESQARGAYNSTGEALVVVVRQAMDDG